ncbi:AraC family transcriptional regulator [Paraburkholderia bryophila]|uniref:AraC family transcriptional regulator n=1 Tax=Paraburkholderia bryophila TaxID=420952 RepID=UPI0023491EA8|nr:AraC family transcriptional regulator [Paraburkholderia bryophila]WCM18324.1 AraC family transcriptional regulator [Paraburkholderia bryophila]
MSAQSCQCDAYPADDNDPQTCDTAAMMTAPLDELRALIARHAGPDSAPLALISGLILVSEPGPTLPCQVVVEPVFSLIVQGAKRVEIGKQAFGYQAGQFLVVSVDLPANAYVVEATPKRPYLGLGLMLRPEAIAGLLLESGSPRAVEEGRAGIAMGELSSDLADSIVRLVRLLDRPSDVPILAASLEREILWRLINGPQGAMIRQIGLADSRMSQIGRTVRWLRGHFAEAVRIEHLAEIAGMSVTSFHRHFRNVTSMTPIQYQKQLRLQAARRRLMTTAEEVSEVGFAVGYESPSQFSREYRRMFGKPPGQDSADLRADPSTARTPIRVV